MNLDTGAAAAAVFLFFLGLIAYFLDGMERLMIASTLAGLVALSLALLGHMVDRRHD